MRQLALAGAEGYCTALSPSGSRFVDTSALIRLPDDCTVGYIIECKLGVRLQPSPLFHSHLETLQLLGATQLPKQVSQQRLGQWQWGRGGAPVPLPCTAQGTWGSSAFPLGIYSQPGALGDGAWLDPVDRETEASLGYLKSLAGTQSHSALCLLALHPPPRGLASEDCVFPACHPDEIELVFNCPLALPSHPCLSSSMSLSQPGLALRGVTLLKAPPLCPPPATTPVCCVPFPCSPAMVAQGSLSFLSGIQASW